MLIHLVLIIITIIIYELLNFVKIVELIRSILFIYKKFFELIKDKKSDDNEKERLIFDYSKTLLIKSFKLLSPILFIVILFYSINFFYDTFLEKIFSIFGIIEITLYVLIYHKARNIINAKL